MGLPARQRRRLENIEHKLRSSDPRLAAMFSIFARLTRDEDMPRIEELRHRAAMLALRMRLWLAAVAGRLSFTRRRSRRRVGAFATSADGPRRGRGPPPPRGARPRGEWGARAGVFP